jgi:dUTP pyrophosphatase
MVTHPILFVRMHPGAMTPTRSHDGDAGFDLYVSERTVLEPAAFTDVPAGIACAFPPGLWGRITGRSSTIRRRGLLVVEGIIDNGYTGPLFAGVWNLGDRAVTVEAGDRLAQLIPYELVRASWHPVEELPKTARGAAGFGSSGR